MSKTLSAIILLFLLTCIRDARAQESPGAASDYMGTKLCSNCHLDIFQKHQKSAHGIGKDVRTPEGKEGCENCHGPGKEHSISAGGKGVGDLILFSAKKDPEPQNQVCLKCHTQGKLALWHSGIHETKKLACASCHQVHSTNRKLMAKPTEAQTCSGCHQQTFAQLQRTSHHPIREQKVECSSCHNPHGTTTEKLISASSINDKCYECHAEKRGPFLWEHPPAREDCMSCHEAQGSSHEALLTARLPYLCQRCHSNSLHVGNMYALPRGVNPETVYQQRPFIPLAQMHYRACFNCHVNVHGSNHPSGSVWHR